MKGKEKVWMPTQSNVLPPSRTFGEAKRAEAVEMLGFDPGSPYARVMDGIGERAIEDFRKRRAESASKGAVS